MPNKLFEQAMLTGWFHVSSFIPHTNTSRQRISAGYQHLAPLTHASTRSKSSWTEAGLTQPFLGCKSFLPASCNTWSSYKQLQHLESFLSCNVSQHPSEATHRQTRVEQSRDPERFQRVRCNEHQACHFGGSLQFHVCSSQVVFKPKNDQQSSASLQPSLSDRHTRR